MRGTRPVLTPSACPPSGTISILSTWIAFEVSTFSSQLPEAGLSVSNPKTQCGDVIISLGLRATLRGDGAKKGKEAMIAAERAKELAKLKKNTGEMTYKEKGKRAVSGLFGCPGKIARVSDETTKIKKKTATKDQNAPQLRQSGHMALKGGGSGEPSTFLDVYSMFPRR